MELRDWTFNRIVTLAEDSEQDADRLDIDITLSKMTDEQVEDLLAMINFLETTELKFHRRSEDRANYIYSQVMHDLTGFKAIALNHPHGIGFSPRSHGYAGIAKVLV